MPDESHNTTPAFTATQGQYLAFLYAYSLLHRRPPAERDFQEFFQVTAPSVHQMILTPRAPGIIGRTPDAARSITLLIPPESLAMLRSASQPVKFTVPRY
jgi:hypothetical protein